MKKLILALLFLSGTLFSQTGASFKFGDVGSWWIPKVKLFGNSTTLTDSTNYVTLNKGLYVFDSIKTDRDLIVKGRVVLDTLRQGLLYYVGPTLTISNSKSIGGMGFDAPAGFNFTSGDASGIFVYNDLINGGGFTVDDNGLSINSATDQIKLPSDTATDYDANDAITLNRQSGKITTKSLTTAADDFYTFTLTNSLISATSKIFINYTGGTVSTGRPTLYRATCGSGSATIILLNFDTTDPLNGTIQLDFVIFN